MREKSEVVIIYPDYCFTDIRDLMGYWWGIVDGILGQQSKESAMPGFVSKCDRKRPYFWIKMAISSRKMMVQSVKILGLCHVQTKHGNVSKVFAQRPNWLDLRSTSIWKGLIGCERQTPGKTCVLRHDKVTKRSEISINPPSAFKTWNSFKISVVFHHVPSTSQLETLVWKRETVGKIKSPARGQAIKGGLHHGHGGGSENWRLTGLNGAEDECGQHQKALKLGDPPCFVAGIWVI